MKISNNVKILSIYVVHLVFLAALSVVFLSVKRQNLDLSKEIKYLNEKILSHHETIKMYKTELTLLTDYRSLNRLARVYSKDKTAYRPAKISQLQTEKKFVSIYSPHAYSKLGIDSEVLDSL